MNLLTFGQLKFQRFRQYIFDKNWYINIKISLKILNKNLFLIKIRHAMEPMST